MNDKKILQTLVTAIIALFVIGFFVFLAVVNYYQDVHEETYYTIKCITPNGTIYYERYENMTEINKSLLVCGRPKIIIDDPLTIEDINLLVPLET